VGVRNGSVIGHGSQAAGSHRRCAGLGRTAAYELIRVGKWPTPILRLGKLIRVPSAPLLELVGVDR
jgi:hypothetical protein